MLVLIVLLLTLVPAVAILYPFIRQRRVLVTLEDESSLRAELARRWEEALAGLRNVEVEGAIGNLSEEDYQWLREQYMTEAATVLNALELEEQEEADLLAQIQQALERVRQERSICSKAESPIEEDVGEQLHG